MSLDHYALAVRLLQRLADEGGIEFVSSRGTTALADPTASLLLRRGGDPRRAEVLAEWLIEQVEVADLFVANDELEQRLREQWDPHLVPERRPATTARNPALEALLIDHPDDPARHLVYGDWLQERGDPYGELIIRQVGGLDSADTAGRGARGELGADAAALLGPLAEYLDEAIHFTWSMGFVRQARVGKDASNPGTYEGPILLRWVLAHRACLLLHTLEIESFLYGRSSQLAEMIDAILATPPPTLRALIIGRGDAGDLARLCPALPRLQTLAVRADRLHMQPLIFPALQTLEIDLGWGADGPAALVESRLPALETLALTGHGRLEGQVEAPLFAGACFPKLRHLRIRGHHDLLERLAGSPLLARLETLDLSGGDLDDDAIHSVLLARRRQFAHLRRLILDDNGLSEAGAAAVAGAFDAGVVLIGEQHPVARGELGDDDDEYYDDAME